MSSHFHPLTVRRITPEAAGAAAITFAVPPALREAFDFRPGQFLTLRANVNGQEVRRSYSICSPHARFRDQGEIDVGIKPVDGGVFSRWAVASLMPGATVDVMPPDGRFTPRHVGARHRVGFAAGSGITPLLSIIATTLAQEPDSHFTLVYGNQRTGTILFQEALADLKDRYPQRLTLVHVLSRQAQEIPLLQGRLDEAKVAELLRTVVPAARIDEAFVCGPEGMIEATERALRAGGVAPERIHLERFAAAGTAVAPEKVAKEAVSTPATASNDIKIQLEVVLDGKTHALDMSAGEHVLDAALAAGLDLPYSCKAGVCCTCRARVLHGTVAMDRNFTLEDAEVAQGFVLTCQARPLGARLVVSYDER